jgi:hypothetical protein
MVWREQLDRAYACLQKQGWLCHIIAHSHGGNVVVEALPQIIAAPSATERRGKITTLGTPFIDTKSLISKTRMRIDSVARMIMSIVFLGLFLKVVLDEHAPAENKVIATVALGYSLLRLGYPLLFGTKAPEVAGKLHFLSIGSPFDEAWQILHHIRNTTNPLAVRSNLISHLFTSLHSHMSQAAEVERTLGIKPFAEMNFAGKCNAILSPFFWVGVFGYLLAILQGGSLQDYQALIFTFVLWHCICLSISYFGIISPSKSPSSALSIYAYLRLTNALASVPNETVLYIVRLKAWSLLQAKAMGLEGYRFELPHIERRPSHASGRFIKYEDMPKGAEQHALDVRSAWISRRFGDVSQTFSKMMVTPADITSLLRTVEADPSLVHGAYYTGDECIARIADWISGRG